MRNLEVPQGLRGLIEAQVEQLGSTEQEVLQIGSVVGVEFAVASVAATLQASQDVVEAACERLARCGQFLEDWGLAEWPDGTVSGRYGFRHALYQEVVYTRMGGGRRVRVHRCVGERLEQAYGERAHEVAAELAMHFERGRDYQRAIRYLQQAAEKASRRSAYRETVAHVTKGLALLATLPDTLERLWLELRLQLILGPALVVMQGQASPEVERVYTRAQDLCKQLGETPALFSVLRGLWICYAAGGKFRAAFALGQQLLALAQQTQDTGHLLEAHRTLAPTLFFLGELSAAYTHAQQGLSLYDPQQYHVLAFHYGQDPGVACLTFAAWLLWHLGYPDQALARGQEALTLARQLSHPHTLTLALYFAAVLHQFRGAWQAAQECAEAALTLATEHAFAFYRANGTIQRGWALAVQGHGEEGIAQMCQGIAAYEATGADLHRTYFFALLAEAYGRAGQVAAGLRLLAQALTVVRTNGEQVYEAELYRLQGELLLQHTPSDTAVTAACFQQALAIARRQQARSLELRAAVSLSRLWQQQGKGVAARQLLAPLYGWFTEGFDTADLQEARALLDELGR